jgi:SpoVK/Ycf46/Vps4 family AAA+-type ATPase
VGETDKLVRGLFNLARKLSPSVIFIDEIDTLLSSRKGGGENLKLYDTMQGLFLQEWDGLSTNNGENGPVIVLGATNRPSYIDKAFLRRMPFILEVPLPNLQGRHDILAKILKSEEMEGNIDLTALAAVTEGFSGSDLKGLFCFVLFCLLCHFYACSLINSLVI